MPQISALPMILVHQNMKIYLHLKKEAKLLRCLIQYSDLRQTILVKKTQGMIKFQLQGLWVVNTLKNYTKNYEQFSAGASYLSRPKTNAKKKTFCEATCVTNHRA